MFYSVEEARLVWRLMRRKPDALYALMNHLLERKRSMLQLLPNVYVAAFGGVRVVNDCYGYEIQIGWAPWAPMVNCTPAYYDLTKLEADLLRDAILGCIPGSTKYAERMRQRKSNVHVHNR